MLPDSAALPEPAREALRHGVGSVLLVDHAALARNVARVRRRIGERFFWAVVKAGGYGLGDVEIARTVLAAGADGLAVARYEELLALRAAGIDAPVLILGPLPQNAPLDDPRTTVTIGSLDDLARVEAQALGCRAQLKLDTGMGRFGLPDEPDAWLDRAAALSAQVDGIWSHYAEADLPGHPRTAAQQARFGQALEALRARGLVPRQTHLANSAGLARLGPDENAVRIGLYLYGVDPWDGLPSPVERPEPVVAWLAAPAASRMLPADHAVGYHGLYRTVRDEAATLLGVGYGDGLPATHRGIEVWQAGTRRPLRGRISMDLAVVGAADPDGSREPAWLLGPPGAEHAIRIEELAARSGRIPYEVLTAIGPRVRRIHLR